MNKPLHPDQLRYLIPLNSRSSREVKERCGPVDARTAARWQAAAWWRCGDGSSYFYVSRAAD